MHRGFLRVILLLTLRWHFYFFVFLMLLTLGLLAILRELLLAVLNVGLRLLYPRFFIAGPTDF